MLFKKQKAYIVFSSEYLIGVSTYGDHHSFDIYKYKRIRDKLISEKILKAKNILYPRPCATTDLQYVHSRKYIKQIQDPIYVNQALKIEINSMWDNSVLEYYKAVCGGTIFAAYNALTLKKPVFNLGGGFHHAQPEKAEGFCLINDVAITIKKLKAEGKINKVLIIDLDYHQGNGNALIFENDEDVFTFSVHADYWTDLKGSANKDIVIPSDISDNDYLMLIKNQIAEIFSKFKADLIFYIAGSDPYEHDSLADMKISRETMLVRNLFVLDKALTLEIPIVVLPGGGYGTESWEIFYDFIHHALTGKR